MRIAIVGSREFTDYEFMKEKFFEVTKDLKVSVIVSGGARGADTLAERLADEILAEKAIFPANWKAFGKGSGFIRNSEIVNNSDIILAFPIGKSSGTWDTIRKGQNKGIPVFVYSS